jgi:hypothetical protein
MRIMASLPARITKDAVEPLRSRLAVSSTMNGPNHYNEQTKLLNALRLPGRLTPEQTATLLGFAPHDIPVLVKAKLLTPLGKPAPNAVKFFAASVIVGLGGDQTWLGKATNAIYSYWLNQNTRRRLGATDADPSAQVLAA